MASAVARYILASLAVLPFAACPAVGAAAGLDAASAKKFFNDKGCNACHGLDEARIGPPYQAIAARYAADPSGRVEKLAAKIRFGGAGAWGVVPMISNPRVSQEEAEAVAQWILNLRPANAAAH